MKKNYEADMVINNDAKGSLDGELGAGRKMAGELTFSVPRINPLLSSSSNQTSLKLARQYSCSEVK